MLAAYPESRRFVMADPGTCFGCKTCMAACLHRHDVPGDVAVPRLALVTTRTVSAPVGCHHCADAPCVAACPTGCLFADDEHVGVRKEKCIGCRNCVLACPYGAVDIVRRPPDPEPEAKAGQDAEKAGEKGGAGGTAETGSAVRGEDAGKAVSPGTAAQAAQASAAAKADKADKPKGARARALANKRRRATAVVVKCDLCIDHAEGPACVAACPTQALRIIDQDYLERGMQAKRKAAARATAAFASIALNAELDEEG